MILLAPLLGAVVLDLWGPAMLFAFAAGSALISLALLGALRRKTARQVLPIRINF